MSLATASGFQVGSTEPIDTRLVLTKQQMKSVDENTMPDVYFANCKDDGFIYVFNRSNTIDSVTGKFRKVASDAIVETETLPAEKENVIYKIKGDDFYRFELPSSDFGEQSVDIKGFTIIQTSADVDMTYNGYPINAESVQLWDKLSDYIYVKNLHFENSELKATSVPAFMWNSDWENGIIVYIIDGNTNGKISINKTSFKTLDQVLGNKSIQIPKYYVSFESEKVTKNYSEDFETVDCIYTAETRILTNKSSSTFMFTSTSDVSKMDKVTTANIYAKDVKLLTETNIAELEEVVDKKIAEVSEIKNLIPEQATTENKLADKNFVNSSIATNTAFFKGVFDDVSKLPTEGVTNNDYAYVTSTDAAGNTIYSRYKFNSETSEWKFEYNLNNTGFTAEQFAAINSGITAENYGGTSAKATHIPTSQPDSIDGAIWVS